MDITNYISVAISLCGLLGGFFSWSLSLKIKADILANNEKLDFQNEKECNEKVGFVTRNTLRALRNAIFEKGESTNDYTLEDFRNLASCIRKDDNTIVIINYSELC